MQIAPPPEVQVINWTAVGVATGLASAVLTLAVVYLKLFIAGEISKMEQKLDHKISAGQKEIMEIIERKFSQKELVQKDLTGHDRRLDRIEVLMEKIRLTKELDDRV